MKPKASTGFARRLLTAAAAFIGLAPVAFAQAPQTFFVLNNPNDPMFNQLLGINNALRAAGFWTDNAGHEHGFVVEINTQTTPVSTTFTELTPAKVSADLGVVAVATQTSNINNNNLVCGFWTDANNNNHGFEVFFNPAAHSFNM